MTTTDETQAQDAAAPARPAPTPAPPPVSTALVTGGVLALVLGAFLFAFYGGEIGTLYLLGLAFGGVLFHSRFGFTSAWRQLIAVRQGRALRAHMLMLAVACVLFAPMLAGGFGHDGAPEASVEPLSLSLVVGAILFGIGMQLGGACASGTLFVIGSGHTGIVITLGGFIVGSVLGAWTWGFWSDPSITGPSFSLATDTPLGYPGALALSLAVMGLIVWLTYVLARGRRVPPMGEPPTAEGRERIWRGSWPIWTGAVALAVLNAITLYVKGSPWGITSAFALWGSVLLRKLGVDVDSWTYWQDPSNAEKLHAPVLADATSVMDLGIVVGALVASAAAGAFVLHRRPSRSFVVGALVGGVLMGYGARLAYGCNIGSYFGGIASFSVHGWVWGLLALVGTWIGLRLRPLFGFDNPAPEDSVC